jgi:CBS domain-containing protein
MASIKNRFARNVIAVAESVSCAEAARVMAEHGIRSVGVRKGRKLIGIVTERDLLRFLGIFADPLRTPVSAALRPDAPTVSADASELECTMLMRKHRTGHLSVQDGGEIVGVISLAECAEPPVEEREEWVLGQLQSYARCVRADPLSQPVTSVFGRRHLRRSRAA